MDKTEILAWLRETDPQRLEELWRRADETRREYVGDAVHLRGLVEISNYCARQCMYCGLRAGNVRLARYRMLADEILASAQQAVKFGYGTVVLQGGEDYGVTTEWMADVIRRIKRETPLAVTLSLGERPDKDLAVWRTAGADRYLLRFETSDRDLFDEIHPPLGNKKCDRLAILRRLRQHGYEVGSGIMIGIPGQTYASVANDIAMFRDLDLDMIGIGPFIPHPATPLGSGFNVFPPVNGEQVPANELMVYKAVALTRLVRPDANIPATTALATINKRNGRELGLQRGANVFMPNLTPLKYRRLYEIYPEKACMAETGDACNGCLSARIRAIGRQIGNGPGGRRDRDLPGLERGVAKRSGAEFAVNAPIRNGLKARNMTARGNAPGPALAMTLRPEGARQGPRDRCVLPFQGEDANERPTQGVALGYPVPAFSAREHGDS